MFAEGIAFLCLYDTEHILTATTKLLVHLLGIYDDLGIAEVLLQYS